jgi:hypothetical protein
MLCVLFAGALLFAGLLIDAGRVMAANADACDLAGKAARAGAQAVDPRSIRTGTPALDATAARSAARGYLDRHRTAGTVAVDGAAVTVTVHTRVSYTLLTLSGRRGETVTQTRSAAAVGGP